MKKSITTLDLNLLLCLQLLMQERSVTKAAKRMNVTPSAVSKSLAKLRAWFDDPLFVNSPLGLSPTPLMVSMEQNLAEWMQMSNLLLDKPHHQTPRGLKFELAAESPLMMIMLNALSFTLLWHKRNSRNPKIVWLRETIKNLYASMA
ncbi:TPA: LysR family transcriptional regulator [Escherichia coli]